MSRVHLNISGQHFEFNSEIVTAVQSGRLNQMVTEAKEEGRDLTFTVDRSAHSFTEVLVFYETGKLHLPTTVCPQLFLDELAYWGISPEHLSECCYYRLSVFLDETETRQHFKRKNAIQQLQYTSPPSPSSGKLHRFRRKLWAIVDFQENTINAKLYYLSIIVMVMLSILSLAISTEPFMKRRLTKCEILEYLKHAQDPDFVAIESEFGEIDCSDSDDSSDVFEEIFNEGMVIEEDGENRTIILDELYKTTDEFHVFEIVFVIYFTVDLILRLFSSPSIIKYFINFLNVIDILALTTSYSLLIVQYVEKEHQYRESWLHILKYFQILRALRLLRVVKTFRASQVLAYSLQENSKDLLILGMFLFLGLSTFSCLIYFAESRDTVASIPVGWYWSIITLTTVGYGDITPKTATGMVIASICAVLGVVLMAVTVPIFVNNFLSLYQYALVDEFVQKKKKAAAREEVCDGGKEGQAGDCDKEDSNNIKLTYICSDSTFAGNKNSMPTASEAWK